MENNGHEYKNKVTRGKKKTNRNVECGTLFTSLYIYIYDTPVKVLCFQNRNSLKCSSPVQSRKSSVLVMGPKSATERELEYDSCFDLERDCFTPKRKQQPQSP